MHWIGRFEDRVSCVLSVAMTLCFPSVSVYGESLSWPGVCPGSQAVQKPEGILLPPVRSGWASWAGGGPVPWRVHRAPGSARGSQGPSADPQGPRVPFCFRRRTAVLSMCWTPCEPQFPSWWLCRSIRALLQTIPMVVLKYVHKLFDIPPWRSGVRGTRPAGPVEQVRPDCGVVSCHTLGGDDFKIKF